MLPPPYKFQSFNAKVYAKSFLYNFEVYNYDMM